MTKLDDLLRDVRKDAPTPDWKTIDDKLFARLEQEPRPTATAADEAASSSPPRDSRGARVVWIGASLALAAAAAVIMLVHPAGDGTERAAERTEGAGAVSGGDVSIVSNGKTVTAHAGTQLARGDRIDVVDGTAYFEEKGAVQWSARGGSVLRVEHPASPLVLSLEKGAAEAQVTPVPSGEAFAIDITASTGSVVRVAVHGTHLRVARDEDKVTIDLTEGVVSIGAPPRRGSTLGTLVTAPAHVELDARDLSAMRVDHASSAVRTAEAVAFTTTHPAVTTTELLAQSSQTNHESVDPIEVVKRPLNITPKTNAPTVTPPPVETWLRSTDELAAAIQTCARAGVTGATAASFATVLTMHVGDDGIVQSARFSPPLHDVRDARECAAIAIYKRTKLTTPGDVTLSIDIKP